MKQPLGLETKKQAILDIAGELGVERFTPAEIEQIRRKMVARYAAEGKTSPEYIAQVLEDGGRRVVLSKDADADDLYEEEFRDLLHFSTLEEAEMCLVRLDELLRKFRAEGQRAAAERVLEVARLGRRRAEMIARNPRVDPHKREEKKEILEWFRIWLQTPDAFFDWLDVRKQSPGVSPALSSWRIGSGGIVEESEAMPETLHRLEVESLDLGAGVRGVGLELMEPLTREPVTGQEAARIWAAILAALAAQEAWALDFFAHIRRVRDFCRQQGIDFREANAQALVIPAPSSSALPTLFEHFAAETFGVRAGGLLVAGDAALEGGLAARGVDAYQAAFPNYLFCAVCDFENGFLTLLSERLWASEVIRRARAGLDGLQVEVTRPS